MNMRGITDDFTIYIKHVYPVVISPCFDDVMKELGVIITILKLVEFRSLLYIGCIVSFHLL